MILISIINIQLSLEYIQQTCPTHGNIHSCEQYKLQKNVMPSIYVPTI